MSQSISPLNTPLQHIPSKYTSSTLFDNTFTSSLSPPIHSTTVFDVSALSATFHNIPSPSAAVQNIPRHSSTIRYIQTTSNAFCHIPAHSTTFIIFQNVSTFSSDYRIAIHSTRIHRTRTHSPTFQNITSCSTTIC